MYIVQCWIEHPVRRLDQTFTYLSTQEVQPGMRVQVDFNGRKLIGFVEDCQPSSQSEEELQQASPFELKHISAVLDREPLLTDELRQLADWLSRTTLATHIACYQCMLPAKIKPVSHAGRAVQERWVSCADTETSLTPRQLEAFLYVRQQGSVRYQELRKHFPNQAKALVDLGALQVTLRDREAENLSSPIVSQPLQLNAEQQAAMQEIEQSSDAVYLLHGVTGSGKTEVYLQLAQKVLEQDRQVLILVPEIGLTPQMIDRVRQRFGVDLAIYHSALSAQEKYEQYRKVKTGRASVVVGTRSAVFLPFTNLGLIVMDEEHDSSYKQEVQPSYHCRDVAIWRGAYHHCKVILGSATPSLESYARGLKQVYHLITLKHRINDCLPEIELVPLKKTMARGESYILTETLKQRMAETLARQEQIILLLNRRGYSTQLRCLACKQVLLCPHCDLALSYHRSERLLKCHACGSQMAAPKACPYCGSTAGFSTYGFGTEKLEAAVKQAFPAARVIRMDADTTARKDAHRKLLEAFGRHEADILLGTQMISKGLDYPDVTLVGILNGDDGVSHTDYRSCETTFDLLMQASGRSGRSEHRGRVVLQVFDPDHYVVQCAVHQNYDLFFRREMQFRHAGQYPPYTYLISLTIVSRDQKKADQSALFLKEHLQASDYKTVGVISLGRLQDRCRNRIFLKGKNLERMREDVRALLKQPETAARLGDVRIDVEPMTLD